MFFLLQAIMGWMEEALSEKSNVSTMRVMAFIALLTGCFIGIYGLVNNMTLGDVAMLASVFVGAAFGGKVLQKIPEVKATTVTKTPVKTDPKKTDTKSKTDEDDEEVPD